MKYSNKVETIPTHVLSDDKITIDANTISKGTITNNATAIPSNSISKLRIDEMDYAITASAPKLNYDNIFEEIAKRFNRSPITKHECVNCGGVLEIDTSKAVFKCPYCKSCYAIGTARINAR